MIRCAPSHQKYLNNSFVFPVRHTTFELRVRLGALAKKRLVPELRLLPRFEMYRKDDISRDVWCPRRELSSQLGYIPHHHLPELHPSSGISLRSRILNFSVRPKVPERWEQMFKYFASAKIYFSIIISKNTFPKLPLPNTAKKWKSSTAYFRKRGIDVAGAVIRPERWNCAYV